MPSSTLGDISRTPTKRLLNVATRTRQMQAFFATNKQFQARSGHFARDDIVNPSVVFPGYYVPNFGFGATYDEHTVGANSVYTAAIEYPSGTFTQIKWGGQTSVSVPDGSFAESDATSLFIPRGALFYIRTFFNNSAGIIFCDKAATHFNGIGDQLTAAVSGLTDNTMGGAYGADDTNNSFSPLAIVANTYQPSVICVGDSRVFGETETSDATGDVGEFARSLGPGIAYANYGVRGDSAVKFLASCNNRVTLARRYFSHVATNYGINDIELNGRNADQIINDRLSIQALTGLPMMHSTVLPHANAANSAANNLGFEATRVALNRALRSRLWWTSETVVDNAAVVEAVPDQPIWKSGYSNDMLHPNQTACLAIQAAKVINPLLFAR